MGRGIEAPRSSIGCIGRARQASAPGAEPMDMTLKRFNAYIREEIASNAALVKAAGITAQ